MAYSIHFVAEALVDQESIVHYLAETLTNHEAAKHFVGELEEVVSLLEEMPGAFPFPNEPRLRTLGYQKALFMNYALLFRVEGEAVYIVRIFHQSQNYAKFV